MREMSEEMAYRLVTFVLFDDDCAGADVFDGVDTVAGVCCAMFIFATGLSDACKMGCILYWVEKTLESM
jgi:hypothetical protein